MEETMDEIEEAPLRGGSGISEAIAIEGDSITKEDAAKLLGLTPRALERYVRAGKLTIQYRPGKTRTIAIFSRGEVQDLADIRSAKKTPADSTAPDKSRPKDGSLIVRLDSYYMDAISKEAQKRHVSPSDYAARLLMGIVDNHRRDVIQDLRDDIDKLADSLAIATEGILVAVSTVGTAHPLSAEDAHDWVADNLRAERSIRPEDDDDFDALGS